ISLERVGQKLLNRIFVVDEQDGRGIRHRVGSLPAVVGFSPPYYSPGMAADPPPARPRARPGSLERPINSRLYRGTWLLVGIPLLIAAFSVGKPAALRAAVPTLPPAFDRLRALALARALAGPGADLARPLPGLARGGKRTAMVRRAGGESRPPGPWGAVHRDDPGPRPCPPREPDRHHSRPLAPGPCRARASRQRRRRAGGERQRLGDRSADRARPLVCHLGFRQRALGREH